MAANEVWRLIPSLPGVMASSKGRVMVIPTLGEMPRGGARHYGTFARRGQWDGERYLFTHKGKTYRVARLICEAFSGPPLSEESVCMHDDENSRNNSAGNLKWGSQKENLNYPGFLAYCRGRTGDNSPGTKGRARAAERSMAEAA